MRWTISLDGAVNQHGRSQWKSVYQNLRIATKGRPFLISLVGLLDVRLGLFRGVSY